MTDTSKLMNADEEAAHGAAPADTEKEEDVKVPVEAADESGEAMEAAEPSASEPGSAAVAMGAPMAGGSEEGSEDEGEGSEQGENDGGMTEEEMVEAAIRAGEEAANEDFKLKYEEAQKELEDLRKQLASADSVEAEADAKAQDAVNRYQRLQADWENYRRRTAQERLNEKARANEDLVTKLLPVIDDMERAIKHAEEMELSEEFSRFVDGVKAVLKKLMTILDGEGVVVIDPKGEEFDPNVHQAIGRVEDASQYADTVNEVYQKGYSMGGKLLRPAMVTVTYGGGKRPAPQPDEGDEADGDQGQGAEGSEQ